MSDYRVSTGTDVVLGSLTVLDPQPRSVGLQYTRTTHAAGGAVYREGAFVELIYSMIETPAQYQSILTAFGLNAAHYAAVTIYAPNDQLSSTRYNGTAVRPALGREGGHVNYFLRDVTIVIRDLTAAA